MSDTGTDQDQVRTRQAIDELSRILLQEKTLTDVMDTVARLARDAVKGADEVSVSLVKDGKAYTVAFTGDVAIKLDERQYEDGYGPCLSAAATGATILVADTATDGTYPDYAAAAAAAGVGSSLSVGLPVPQGTVGGLNIYSLRAHAFDEEAVGVAQTFAGAAAVSLANAALYEDARRLTEQMQQAMQSRAVIEQAKGILMRDNRCSADEAFSLLVKASNRSNRKLHEIARSIVEGTVRGA